MVPFSFCSRATEAITLRSHWVLLFAGFLCSCSYRGYCPKVTTWYVSYRVAGVPPGMLGHRSTVAAPWQRAPAPVGSCAWSPAPPRLLSWGGGCPPLGRGPCRWGHSRRLAAWPPYPSGCPCRGGALLPRGYKSLIFAHWGARFALLDGTALASRSVVIRADIDAQNTMVIRAIFW